MPKTKVEVYNKDQLIYPFIESDHVTFSNGMKVNEMLDQSISMPTVTHEDLSFKVGVGDQDVSSAIVDSSVSEMTIKGKTYQNILPEPSTHVLTNNKEIFKVNEGLDPNIEIVDGVSKSAILKGNTLVNIYKITESTPYTYKKGSSPSSKLTVNLLANKTYLILLDFSTVNKDGKSKINFFPMSTFIDGTKKQESNFDIDKNGRFTYKYTPTKDVKEYGIIIGQNNFEQNNPTVVLESAMIIEYQQGMENWVIPYFEGMQSVKAPVLQTVGKNLFDKVSLGLGGNAYTNTVEYLPQLNNNTRATLSKGKLITVEPNSTVTLSCDNRFKCVIQEYDENENRTKSGDKGWQNGGSHTLTVGEKTNKINIYFAKQDPHSSEGITDEELSLLKNSIQMETSSSKTTYEPYKTNILSTPEEVVLRSLPNGICDTLNLMTGEYVQRISEINLSTSSSATWWQSGYTNDTLLSVGSGSFTSLKASSFLICNVLPSQKGQYNVLYNIDFDSEKNLRINVPKTIANDVSGFMSWLRSNNVIIIGELETPIVRTVDLSSSGNWEKIVLDGKSSENWQQNSHSGNFVQFDGYSNFCFYSIELPLANRGLLCDKLSYYGYDSGFRHKRIEGISDGGGYRRIFVRVKTKKLPTNDVAGFKQWLSQNPIEVSYMLSSNKDSTQVKQPIFFKDGHIIQSSGADKSLIPTLDYQAKTSNSYVMDLMKTNTIYTMKSSTHNGGYIYIDGKDYTMGLNRQFTSPSSMTNKLLVVDGVIDNLMILEGNLTSTTIPYFKGIKSAFEDESKIEVLSTGKNLITDVSLRKINGAIWDGDVLTYSGTSNDLYYTYSRTEMTYENAIKVKVGSCYEVGLEVFSGEVNVGYSVAVATFDKDLNVVRWLDGRFVVQQGEEYVGSIRLHGVNAVWTNIKFRMWMEEVDISSNVGAYEPYKSNNTKIPLLSPLRSLPNGVYDEIILDREKNKATLIQRVGYVMLNGSEEWNLYPSMEQDKTLLFQTKNPTVDGKNAYCVSDKYFHSPSLWSSYYNEGIQLGGGNPISRIDLRIYKGKVSSNNATILRKYLSKDPIVVLYELATPIITEVDIEGFPYIYKDGHIFLNSEIVPTTEIIYSVNQCQQISASNEDIIRHEKELTYLQKLIAQYVQVDYESALLSLKV